jgi:small subunit ribosomal protein S4
MQIVKCKKCIRATEKLFLKGDRCYSPKCSLTRKSFASSTKRTGRKRVKALSEYGVRLREKQKIKFGYGLREKPFANCIKEATKNPQESSGKAFEILESRLANVVFRMGLFSCRSLAKQVVSHGHIFVNGRRVTIPSYRVKVGDKISIRPQSNSKGFLKDVDIRIKKYNAPAWINFDKGKLEAEITGTPLISSEPGTENKFDTMLEFYSR